MTINPEHLEKMRQAVMRYRELLDIFRAKLDAGERAYEALFDAVSPEDRAQLPQKALQGKAAEILLDDPAPIQKALLNLRFVGREMEREFEQVYNNLVFDEEEEDLT